MRDGGTRFALRMLERHVAQLTERLERVERELCDSRNGEEGEQHVSTREEAKALIEKFVTEYVALEARVEELEGRAEIAERALANSKERVVKLEAEHAKKDAAARRMLAALDNESGDLMGLSREFYEAEAELRKAFGPPKEDA